MQINVLQCTNYKASTFCKEVLLACDYIHLLKSRTQIKRCVLPQARWCGSQYKPCSTCYVAIFCVHICPENFILPFYSSFSRGVGERIKLHFFNGYGSCNYLFLNIMWLNDALLLRQYKNLFQLSLFFILMKLIKGKKLKANNNKFFYSYTLCHRNEV